MTKYHYMEHYVSNDKILNIYIYRYITKKGLLKFHIEIYGELIWNNSGFCSMIANYNTSDNALLEYINQCHLFTLKESKKAPF